jgi:hypothetical protein
VPHDGDDTKPDQDIDQSVHGVLSIVAALAERPRGFKLGCVPLTKEGQSPMSRILDPRGPGRAVILRSMDTQTLAVPKLLEETRFLPRLHSAHLPKSVASRHPTGVTCREPHKLLRFLAMIVHRDESATDLVRDGIPSRRFSRNFSGERRPSWENKNLLATDSQVSSRGDQGDCGIRTEVRRNIQELS